MTPPRSNAPARLVVGCGYLGTRVAERWLAAGCRVHAITRSPSRAGDLAARGIEPIIADVTRPETCRDLPDVATVFWAVGFDRSAGMSFREVHVDGLARLIDALPGRPRIILSSSTGVWGTDGGELVTEATPPEPVRDAGRILLEAESILHDHAPGRSTALRFAGLYGPGRLPRLEDLKAGRPIAADPDSWLNLIHVDDAAAIVCAIAEAVAPKPLYVVSDNAPLRRRDWYARLAEASSSPAPTWDSAAARSRGGNKRVDPGLLFRDIPIRLEHPDALAAIADLVGHVDKGQE
ncbi:MAG: SDR family oxidoreductase [Planctomycetia bacterium]